MGVKIIFSKWNYEVEVETLRKVIESTIYTITVLQINAINMKSVMKILHIWNIKIKYKKSKSKNSIFIPVKYLGKRISWYKGRPSATHVKIGHFCESWFFLSLYSPFLAFFE